MPRRSLQEALAAHLDDAKLIRESDPPVAVEPGGMIDPPRKMTNQEIDEEGTNFLSGVAETVGLMGKGTVCALSFATDKIDRADSVFRATILTAVGRVPVADYPSYFRETLSGKRKISGDGFWEIALGQALSKQLDEIPILPGWTKRVVSPLPHLAGVDVRNEPVVSVGRVLGLGAEFFVSPFAVMGALPAKFFTASKVGRVMAKAHLDPSTSLLTLPVRKFAQMATSSSTPWGAMLLQLRDPLDALGKHTKVVDSMVDAGLRLEDAGDQWGRTLVGIAERHISKASFIGLGGRPGLGQRELATVWDHLFFKDQSLSEAQRALVDDIMEKVLKPVHSRLQEMGYASQRLTQVKAPARHRGPGVEFEAVSAPVRGQVTVRWDPEKDLLRKFNPTPYNYRFPANAIGTKNIDERLGVNLHWRRKGEALPYEVTSLTEAQKNPLHSLEQWLTQAERKMILEERVKGTKGSLEATGLLSKFAPRDKGGHLTDNMASNVNAELSAMNNAEWRYYINKLHDFTGNRAGKLELTIDNTMDRFFAEIDKGFDSVARKSRIFKYFYEKSRKLDPRGFPAQNTTSAIASSMTAGTVIATLGLNLSSALKNTSQLLNTMAKEGIPGTIRGLYKMVDYWSDEGKALRDLRKSANFKSEFRKVIYDDVWIHSGKRGVDGFLMWPFSTTEMWMRGIAFNVSVGRDLQRRGIHSAAQLAGLHAREVASIVRFGRREAIDTNFLYGIAGRSHLMMNPLARVGFALQSYSWKQAEFIARTWKRDGGAFMRLVGLHGWAIDMADKMAGVNAENWLGWGFLPPNTLGRGPAFETLTNLVHMSFASADGNDAEFAKRADALRGHIREVFRTFGDPDDHVGLQAALGAASLSGLLPVPMVGVARTFKVFNEFMTGERSSSSGRTWQRVGKGEALKSWFFTTHRQAEDARLRAMDSAVRRQVDSELDRRVRKYLKAIKGRDGDEVVAAAKELGSPVGLSLPLSGSSLVRFLPSGFRLGDERSFWPHPEMIESRIKLRSKQLAVSRDVVEMIDSGWAGEVLWAEYSNRGLAELARGAIRVPER